MEPTNHQQENPWDFCPLAMCINLLERDDRLEEATQEFRNAGLRRVVGEGAGPQRPAGPVGSDDDARGRSLRAHEREFAWRDSIRKETFAGA